MKVSEQGIRADVTPARHSVIPRTLLFITSVNAQGESVVLLLRGAPTKRLWANRYNGLGGHVEADEDLHSAALRELAEETGISPDTLALRGVVHIDTNVPAINVPAINVPATNSNAGAASPGIMVFVFRGQSAFVEARPSAEGTAEWIPLARVAELQAVDDLTDLLERALGDEFFYGHYQPDGEGNLARTFQPNFNPILS